MGWTHFWDMHSGGKRKLAWDHVFIEAPEEEATRLFAEAFSRDPSHVTCGCCGEDYSVTESATLQEATAYHRHLRYVSPLAREEWFSATKEERIEANRLGRYLEPGEPLPDGWHHGWAQSVAEAHTPMPLTEFLADPHFEDFGRRVEVKILQAPRGESK